MVRQYSVFAVTRGTTYAVRCYSGSRAWCWEFARSRRAGQPRGVRLVVKPAGWRPPL